jgi:hypothetical protein
LYALPSNWHRIDQCGAAWLIGRWEIVGVDQEAITIKPPLSSSRLKIRKPAQLDTLGGGKIREEGTQWPLGGSDENRS